MCISCPECPYLYMKFCFCIRINCKCWKKLIKLQKEDVKMITFGVFGFNISKKEGLIVALTGADAYVVTYPSQFSLKEFLITRKNISFKGFTVEFYFSGVFFHLYITFFCLLEQYGIFSTVKQSDMCLVCIAFASWVLKSSDPDAADAWKAGIKPFLHHSVSEQHNSCENRRDVD